MEFDWVGHCMCSFGSNSLGTASKFKIMSFRQKIDLEYVVNISKLPDKLSIDPRNSKTMKKLKLQFMVFLFTYRTLSFCSVNMKRYSLVMRHFISFVITPTAVWTRCMVILKYLWLLTSTSLKRWEES